MAMAGTAAPCVLRRRDGARDQRAGEKRPRGVVNEDEFGRGGAQRFKSGAHRGLPRGAAPDRRQQMFSSPAVAARKTSASSRMNDRLHGVDLRVTEKGRQRRPDHRLAGDLAILLWAYRRRRDGLVRLRRPQPRLCQSCNPLPLAIRHRFSACAANVRTGLSAAAAWRECSSTGSHRHERSSEIIHIAVQHLRRPRDLAKLYADDR